MTKSKASGWELFAGILLLFAGIGRVLDGIWAIRNDGEFPKLEGAVFGDSLALYGWLWLLLGIVLLVAAGSLFQGHAFGRWIGIIAAMISGFGALLWLPYYPVWSLAYIGLATLIAYGLAVKNDPGYDSSM